MRERGARLALIAAAALAAGSCGTAAPTHLAATRQPAGYYATPDVAPDGGIEVPTTVAEVSTTVAEVSTTAPRPKPPARPRPPRASQTATPAPAGATGDLLDALAWCETRRRNIASPNDWYHSYFQWARYTTTRRGKVIHVDTWKSVGGEGRAEDHSYDEQKEMVRTKIPVSSWGTQFPNCARKLGVA